MTPLQKTQKLLLPSQRRSAMWLVVLIFIGMALETLGIGLVIPAVSLMMDAYSTRGNRILQPILDVIGQPTYGQLVAGGVGLLVMVYAIKAVFLTYLTVQQMRFAYGVQEELSQRLFTIYLHKPYTFHLQRNSAQLIRNVLNETGIFSQAVLNAGFTLVTEGVVLAGLTILLLAIEPVGALLVVTALGLAAWSFHSLTKDKISHWGEIRQVHEGLRLQHLQQGLGGTKVVKLAGRESAFIEPFLVHNLRSTQVAQWHSTLQNLPRLWLEFLSATGLAVLVLVMLAQGKDVAVVLSTIGMFAAAAFRIIPSVNRVQGSIQSIRYGSPVINVLYDELQDPEVIPVLGHTKVLPLRQAIKLEKVSYRYHSASTEALCDVSLVVHRGSTVGIVGRSGAGKSTLVDVLLGLLPPTHGQVRVDGLDIQSSLRGWQDQVGYVPQSIFLIDDTIRRNVAFGLADGQIDDEAVWYAVRAAELEPFVNELPQGLETRVGERGIRLSGGQRQRIGIARALYHNPSILILDEATSALDTTTEESILEAIKAMHGAKTIIIVAHRFTTVAHCDHIFRLEKGRVMEEGTYAQVIGAQAG